MVSLQPALLFPIIRSGVTAPLSQPPALTCLCSSGAGADFVMMGGMLAGHDQCSGEVIEKNGKKYKLFYGMSSDTAMKKYVGGVAEYR